MTRELRSDYDIHAHNARLIASISITEDRPIRPPPNSEPANLRGVPLVARGVGGASPGTDPPTAAIRHLDRRWGSHYDAIDQAKRNARWESQLDGTRWRQARNRGADGGKVRKGRIIARDGATCYLCQRTIDPDELHLEHVIPIAHGGDHTEANLALACPPCNQAKADHHVSLLISDRTPRYHP